MCDAMKEELENLDFVQAGSITMVDIDKDPDLAKRFNDLIPALFVDNVEICHFKLNKKRLLRFLASE